MSPGWILVCALPWGLVPLIVLWRVSDSTELDRYPLAAGDGVLYRSPEGSGDLGALVRSFAGEVDVVVVAEGGVRNLTREAFAM